MTATQLISLAEWEVFVLSQSSGHKPYPSSRGFWKKGFSLTCNEELLFEVVQVGAVHNRMEKSVVIRNQELQNSVAIDAIRL